MNKTTKLLLVTAAILAGLIANLLEAPAASCTTDTECMEMFGGDGGPEVTK